MTDLTARPATPADAQEWVQLRREAFASSLSPTDPPPMEVPDSQLWVTEAAGRVVAISRDNHFTSWFGGNLVATCGISSVAAQSEWRGRGALARLFPALLDNARDRGAPISTLFPTSPGYYRRFGFEVIGSYDWIDIATPLLASPPDPALTVERVTQETWPDVEACYAAWASDHNGPLDRSADTRFGLPSGRDRARAVAEHDFVTLVRDASGAPRGFAAWERESGYRADGTLNVYDLCALDVAAFRRLTSVLATHSAVAPLTRIATSGWGEPTLALATAPGTIRETTPYMLAILDVAGALTRRGYGAGVTERLRFSVTGLPLPEQDGCWELTVADGRAECTPAPVADLHLDARGLAVLYGGGSSARARWAGLLTGSPAAAAACDRVFGGLGFAVRDYF